MNFWSWTISWQLQSIYLPHMEVFCSSLAECRICIVDDVELVFGCSQSDGNGWVMLRNTQCLSSCPTWTSFVPLSLADKDALPPAATSSSSHTCWPTPSKDPSIGWRRAKISQGANRGGGRGLLEVKGWCRAGKGSEYDAKYWGCQEHHHLHW